MKLPFGWELRQQGSFTDSLVEQIQRNAGGAVSASVTATAAVEACAGIVGRAFASAMVKAAPIYGAAVEPEHLMMIGRELIRSGELVFLIDTSDGRLSLLPAQSFTVEGPPNPANWTYEATIGGPDSTLTYHTPAAAVLHFMYAVSPSSPYRGDSPMDVASQSGRLSAETVKALADESAGPHGNLIPIPSDGQDGTVEGLRSDIAKLNGRAALVERGDWDIPQGGFNATDWTVNRLGANPPGWFGPTPPTNHVRGYGGLRCTAWTVPVKRNCQP